MLIFMSFLIHFAYCEAPLKQLPFKWDSKLGGVETPYTARVLELLRGWKNPPVQALIKNTEGFKIFPIETVNNETYIGALQIQKIAAPIERVASVLEDFASYPALFDDLIKTEVHNKMGNRLILFSELSIPIPFVPNERDEIIYLIDSSREDVRLFRYQLSKSNNLKANDGFILLEHLGKDSTLYSEIDLLDADWGIAKSFGVNHIWKKTLQGLIQSDLAIRLRAEHPDWKLPLVKEESQKLASKFDFTEILKHKQTWEKLFSNP